MRWKIEAFQEKQIAEVVSRWHLDSPKPGFTVEDKCLLNGWALAREGNQSNLHYVLHLEEGTFSCPMNAERLDVPHVLKIQKKDEGITYNYGFNILLDRYQIEGGVRLGFESHGLIQWMATLSVTEE